jgi:cytochrome P450 family 135
MATIADRRVQDLPPGPTDSATSQMLQWVRRPLPFLDECRARYGDVFTIRWPKAPPTVMLADPDAVRAVFTGDHHELRSGEANLPLQAALGWQSLLLLDGHEHLRERKLMLPPFHGERMRAYRDTIAEVTTRDLAEWPAERPLEVAPRMRAITLEVIMRNVFGVDELGRLRRLERALVRLLDSITSPFRLAVLLLLTPAGPTVRAWQRVAPTIRRVNALLYEEIARSRADPRLEDREDILALLVRARDEDGAPMTDTHLRDELMTLLVAGHETTATALAWAIERLARHPEMQDRLAAEALANDGDSYADAVAKETLRVRTVLPFAIRQLATPQRIAGFDLPAGVRVAPSVYLVHRDPEVYPEPDRFRPERFLEQPAGTYTWIPFGGGTRRCLGGAFALFEMKTVLSVLVAAGRVRPAVEGDEPPARRGVTITPAHGGQVWWEPARGPQLRRRSANIASA